MAELCAHSQSLRVKCGLSFPVCDGACGKFGIGTGTGGSRSPVPPPPIETAMRPPLHALIRPPELRVGEEAGAHRHATWLELFYDLVFVAAVGQLGSVISGDYTPGGFLRFGVFFVLVWWLWVGPTFYATRFDSDDLVHRLFTLGQMAAAACLAVHVPTALETGAAGFALSYAGARLLLVFEYVRAGRAAVPARPLTSRFAAAFGAAVLLWTASAFVPSPWRFGLWALAFLADLLAPLVAGRLVERFPPHAAHLPERVGLFTIIVLGETILAAVSSMAEAPRGLLVGVTALLGLVIAFAIWWAYFDGIQAAEERPFSTAGAYRAWLYAHPPLLAGIAATGIGVEHVITHGPAEPAGLRAGTLLCASMAVCMAALLVLLFTSPEMPHGPGRRGLLAMHAVPVAALLALSALAGTLPGVSLIAALALVWVARVVGSLALPKPAAG